MTKKLHLLIVGLAFCLSISGQQTEADILSQANKLFKTEKYVEATPLYLRLLSLSPKNPEYNFRYGTCLLYNADKKQEALRYLKFATDQPQIDPLAFYFLGKAYHLNYLFNDAVRSYEKFASLADPKDAAKYQTNRLVETCQNGRRLLMNYSEMIVFDKKEIESDKFFRLYDLKDIGGTILVNAEFQSKLDKKNGHIPLVYFAKNATEIFYASYGETGENGKEIYRRRRMPTGVWGEAELLKGKVNTSYDEDFCYRTHDGKYLYFSSKGHNSMGGYDVFRSEYDETTDSFGEPENMDFAISSPDDDIFFLVDPQNENGYFASARQSASGKLYVYKIRVDKLPTQLSVIAGIYESKLSTKPPKLAVQVENPTGQIVGNFESDNNGGIVLSFPTGGQFKYKMTLDGSSEVFTANVNIPYKKAIKPLRQNFTHMLENGKEVVRVLDRFDETVSNKDDVMAALFAQKASLDPNADKFDLTRLNNIKETDKIIADAGAKGYTMSEIATEMQGKASSIRVMENEAGNIEKKAAYQIDNEIKNLRALNENLAINAENYRAAPENSMTRQKLLDEAKVLLEEKKTAENKIQDLLDINQKVQENLVFYQDIKDRAAEWEKKGAQLKSLLEADKNDEALTLIEQNKVIIRSAITDTVVNYQKVTTNQIGNLNREMTTLNALKFNYETSSKDLRNNIDYLEKFLVEGKGEDAKTTKQNIELKKKDLSVIHKEIESIEHALKTKRDLKETLVNELSVYNALDSRPMPSNLVQMQEVKDNWLAMQSTPKEDAAAYLAEAIRRNEDGNLANVETNTNNSPTEKYAVDLTVGLLPDYASRTESIQSNANLSAKDKADARLRLEKENETHLTNQLAKIERELQNNPENADLKQKSKSLNVLIAENKGNIGRYSDELAQELSRDVASNLDENVVSSLVDNTYPDVKSFLLKDVSMDEITRLQTLNDHENAYLTKIEARKAQVQKQLASDPNKMPELQKEIDILETLVDKTRAEIVRNDGRIADLNTLAKNNSENNASQKLAIAQEIDRIDARVLALDNTYQQDVNSLQNNTGLSEIERAQQLILVDKFWTESVQKEMARLQEIANTNTEVQSLELKLEQMNESLAEKQQLIASRELKIAAMEQQAAALVTEASTNIAFEKLSPNEQKSIVQKRINWTYDEDKREIDAISANAEERLVSLISLDKEAQNLLQLEKKKLNPQNESAQIAIVDQMLDDIQNSLMNNQLTLLALPESNDELVARLVQNYADEKNKIDMLSSDNELNKLKQYIALEQNKIRALEKEKEKYKRLSEDNPQATVLTEKVMEIQTFVDLEKRQLQTLEKELIRAESQLATNNPAEQPTTNTNFEQLSVVQQQDEILSSVNPLYKTKKQAFSESTEISRVELDKEIQLDQQMLNELAQKKASLSTTQTAEFKTVTLLEEQLRNAITDNEIRKLTVPETPQQLFERLSKTQLLALDVLKQDLTLSDRQRIEKNIAIENATLEALHVEKAKIQKLALEYSQIQGFDDKLNELATVISAKKADISALESQMQVLTSTDLASNQNEENTRKGYANIEALRTELLVDTQVLQDENAASLENLNLRVAKLQAYKIDLQNLDTNFAYLEKTKAKDYTADRKLIAEEIATVQKAQKKAMISIGELETQIQNSSIAETTAKYEDPTLQKIVEKENKLKSELNQEVSLREARKIEKKLIATIDERVDRENDLTRMAVGKKQTENADKLTKLKEIEATTVTEKLSIELATTRYVEMKEEVEGLEKKAKQAQSPQEEAEWLSQAMAKQIEASELLEISYVDAKIDRLTQGRINTLLTKENIQARRKTLLIEEANLTAQIQLLDDQIRTATKEKEKEKLFEQRKQIDEKRTIVTNDIAHLDKKIASAPTKGNETIPAEAKAKALSYLEERKIAESEVYKELSRAAYDANFLEREIEILLASIDKEKAEAHALVQGSMIDKDGDIDQLVLKKIERIEEKEKKLAELKTQLTARQMDMKRLMPSDSEEAANVQNLLARGVDPMSKSDAVEFIPIPENGFAITTTNATKTVKAKPIVSQTPTGLMYRVQIGAFRNPVAEDVFNEFTPVSAEKRSSGLLVYMAGYFEGNKKAAEAQRAIRSIGYSDAFVVAYCDGERITLAEARRLEETNACKPIELSELAIRAAAPDDTAKVMVTELDYYKGIGAAPALPVETKKGLFYTVQLGVYNRPVSMETLKNMTPLITKRLPNGQIRYSAGVYVSIEEAMPKREQAFAKGITDAYITVYYDGERISLAEAEKLLQTTGVQIIEKTAVGIVKDVDSRLKAEEKLAADIQKIVENKLVEGMKIQLVSKKQYDEFPRDILNRFNSHAPFYFDINDKRIKSNLYQKMEEIPQVYFLRNELDTVFISEKQLIDKVIAKDLRNVTFEISNAQLGGDLTDFLLRLNYRKEFVQEGSAIKVIVHEVPSNLVQNIADRLRTLKIRAEIIDPAR